MTPTHTLRLADGYGEVDCELVNTDGPLAVVRVSAGAYWEKPRVTTRVVRSQTLRPIGDHA